MREDTRDGPRDLKCHRKRDRERDRASGTLTTFEIECQTFNIGISVYYDIAIGTFDIER
jgi:hypothetical protein